MRVSVEGGGEMGEALARVAKAAGSQVVDGLDADIVLLTVPAAEVRPCVRKLAPGPSARVIVATRGLEPGTGKRLSQVVEEESACLRVGAIAGPILPAELRRKSPCAAVVASPFEETCRAASTALHSPLCRVYTSSDLAGVEVAGALVEVLAMALGAARGLGLGVGAQAMLVSRGVAEGMRIGGDARTFAGLAGVGDLVAAAALPDHPGHVRGLALARGERDADAVALCDALLRRSQDLPITGAVRRLAAGEVRAAEVIADLMQRELRVEFE